MHLQFNILLGEMLSAIALLASTLKIKGRISLQIQASGTFKWAMAECTHLGEVRALADYEEDPHFLVGEDSSTVLKCSNLSGICSSISSQNLVSVIRGLLPLIKSNI